MSYGLVIFPGSLVISGILLGNPFAFYSMFLQFLAFFSNLSKYFPEGTIGEIKNLIFFETGRFFTSSSENCLCFSLEHMPVLFYFLTFHSLFLTLFHSLRATFEEP